MKNEIQKIRSLPPRTKKLLLIAGLLIGLLVGGFVAFNVMFLFHVLPHGGL